MDIIFNTLSDILELLEQIDTITQNQKLVLLEELGQPDSSDEVDEEACVSFLEGMVECKGELITQLEQKEAIFQEAYTKGKDLLMSSGKMKEVKNQVEIILKKKDLITEHEKENLLLLNTHSKRKEKPMEIHPKMENVVAAYKRQATKND